MLGWPVPACLLSTVSPKTVYEYVRAYMPWQARCASVLWWIIFLVHALVDWIGWNVQLSSQNSPTGQPTHLPTDMLTWIF